MFHTILFDLDGTLTDSREGIVNSVKYTIEKLGGTMPDAQTLLKFIGPPLQESFMEHCGYSREKAVEGVRVFREHYVPVGQYENEAAPGIRDVLERLKAKGYTLALASSKPEELCVSICRRLRKYLFNLLCTKVYTRLQELHCVKKRYGIKVEYRFCLRMIAHFSMITGKTENIVNTKHSSA